VHINTGGYPNVIGNKLGNMTSVPSAGFDPIFFFWHSMVDRLGALWQAGHPGAWMDSVSNNVDLLPFRTTAAQVRYWKSAGARDVTALGYTYPELAKISDLDSLQEVVDELYVDQARGGSRGGFASDAPNIILTAQYETNEVGPFDLDIHYGKGHLLGSIVNFVTPQSADCGNCKKNKEEHHTVTSTILLTQNLQELYEEGKLESLDNLEQALSGKISWTCRSLALGEEGREIPESEFKSLRIVVSKRADAAGDGSRGGFVDSPPVPLKGITDGKPFGLRKGEEFKFDTE
jgi:tyrosinase